MDQGSMVAVRFTPPNGSALVKVRFYIAANPYAFNVSMFNDDRQRLPYSWTVNPTSLGWVSLDPPLGGMVFDRDIYIAMEFAGIPTSTGVPSPLLGVQAGNPSGRNYEIYNGGTLEWLPSPLEPTYTSSRSYMIEATFATGPALVIDSPLDVTRGAGCYHLGDTVEISTPATVGVGNGKRLIFDGWSGGYAGNATSASIKIMNLTTVIKAAYRTEYYLDFSSRLGGGLNGTGWYPAGSRFNLTAPERVWFVFEFRAVDGDVKSTISSFPVVVNRPLHLTAYYRFNIDLVSLVIVDAAVVAIGLIIWAFVSRRRRKVAVFRVPTSEKKK